MDLLKVVNTPTGEFSYQIGEAEDFSDQYHDPEVIKAVDGHEISIKPLSEVERRETVFVYVHVDDGSLKVAGSKRQLHEQGVNASSYRWLRRDGHVAVVPE